MNMRRPTPGTDLGIFTFDSLICGMAICYDLRFPELFRLYARKGVHAVFVPAAWPQSRTRHWELFIASTGCRNPDVYHRGKYDRNYTGRSYSGASMTADPHGSIISRADEAEQLLFFGYGSVR